MAKIVNPEKGTWSNQVISEIQYKAENGKYRIRGCGSPRRVPNFDDLMILPGQLTRMPIDTYRESCSTRTVLGPAAENPLVIETPVMIAGMSFGALSKHAKIALAKATSLVGTVISNGEGGCLPEEMENSYRQSIQILASRMGFHKDLLFKADMLEILFGIGAKPGLAGHLMGAKITEEISKIRQIPAGIDLHSHPRSGDSFGADDLVVKIEQLREMLHKNTGGHTPPIFAKIAAARVREDIKIAVKAGFDGIILDGCTAGTGAAPVMAADHLGIPILPAAVQAVRTLEEIGAKDRVSLIVSGGVKDGADLAKALAIGADAIAIGTAAMVAMGCRVCMNCQAGRCAFGIGTQDPELVAKLDIDEAAHKVANYIKAMTEEAVLLAKAAGKTKLQNLEREDLRSLTLESCAMTGIPLAGSDLVFGEGFGFAAGKSL
ncbi:MAG: FMN-binding glutamate synthase family protein [Intestinimonas sp.]|jgi:glutamate synthase domain-containing protein 2|nr:FMN-binding glutamate synthase family protein [Intestinimonas sp.]